MIRLFQLKPNYSKRTFGLDVIRAIAILTVVLVHGNIFLQPLQTEFPWIRLIDGVEIFFTLSGFLIGSIFIKTVETKGFSFATVAQFLKRRWFRTLPNYFFIVLINLVFAAIGWNSGLLSHFSWKFLVFLQNFNQISTGFFPESWSITIEEWFYLLFPFITVLLFKLAKGFKTKHIVLTTILLFLLIPFVLRLSVIHIDELWMNVRMKGIVQYKLDSIAFGLLGAFIKYYYPAIWTTHRKLYAISGLLLVYGYLYIEKENILFIGRLFNSWIISFCILLLFPYADSIKKGPGLFAKCITHISLISYSMYLLNYSLIFEPMMKFIHPDSTGSILLEYVTFWMFVILSSTLLYKFFEKPMMDLRDRK